MSEVKNETQFEIGHVLFIDIVGYSRLLIEEQKERLNQLTEIVLGTAPVREATDEQLLRLPTGDGMALIYSPLVVSVPAWDRGIGPYGITLRPLILKAPAAERRCRSLLYTSLKPCSTAQARCRASAARR